MQYLYIHVHAQCVEYSNNFITLTIDLIQPLSLRASSSSAESSTSESESSSSSESLKFDDGWDDDLIGDDDDRKRLEQMTEAEREQEMFNRCVCIYT